MSNKSGVLKSALLLICSIIFVNNAMAKTWFLPEYMDKLDKTYRNRVSDRSSRPAVAASECSKFKDSAGKALLTPAEIPSGHICTNYPNAVINKNCVGNCKCDPSKYVYNKSNCTGDWTIGGSTCTDDQLRGTQCLCKTDLFPYVKNGSSCKFEDASKGVCKDKPTNKEHYKMCYPDTCFKYSNLVDSGSASCKWGCPSYVDANCSKCNASSCYTDDCHLYDHPAVTSCKWGCKSTSSAICTSKCAECYPDNCRNRTDNKTEYGCAKYWDDCSSKCQTGQTCTKRDCAAEGYIQTACPANASCGEPCQPGCGDTTNYYKYGTCNINFIDLETYWCDAAVKCTWDGSFVPVECTTLGYTLTGSNGCSAGQSQEFCPQNGSYYKCTGEIDASAKCLEEGYDMLTKVGGLPICPSGQTVEWCPYMEGPYKCTGEAEVLPDPIDPVLPTLCIDPSDCTCSYGYLADGYKEDGSICYRCGTESECDTGTAGNLYKCFACKILSER